MKKQVIFFSIISNISLSDLVESVFCFYKYTEVFNRVSRQYSSKPECSYVYKSHSPDESLAVKRPLLYISILD